MSINCVRSWLYAAAKLLGDFQAIKHHRVIKRVQNRLIGKFAGKVLGKLWR